MFIIKSSLPEETECVAMNFTVNSLPPSFLPFEEPSFLGVLGIEGGMIRWSLPLGDPTALQLCREPFKRSQTVCANYRWIWVLTEGNVNW